MKTRSQLIERLLTLPAEIEAAELDATRAAERLSIAETTAIHDGRLTGKNELERKAQLTTLTREEDNAAAECRVRLHALQNEFTALRSVVRLLSAPVE